MSKKSNKKTGFQDQKSKKKKSSNNKNSVQYVNKNVTDAQKEYDFQNKQKPEEKNSEPNKKNTSPRSSSSATDRKKATEQPKDYRMDHGTESNKKLSSVFSDQGERIEHTGRTVAGGPENANNAANGAEVKERYDSYRHDWEHQAQDTGSSTERAPIYNSQIRTDHESNQPKPDIKQPYISKNLSDAQADYNIRIRERTSPEGMITSDTKPVPHTDHVMPKTPEPSSYRTDNRMNQGSNIPKSDSSLSRDTKETFIRDPVNESSAKIRTDQREPVYHDFRVPQEEKHENQRTGSYQSENGFRASEPIKNTGPDPFNTHHGIQTQDVHMNNGYRNTVLQESQALYEEKIRKREEIHESRDVPEGFRMKKEHKAPDAQNTKMRDDTRKMDEPSSNKMPYGSQNGAVRLDGTNPDKTEAYLRPKRYSDEAGNRYQDPELPKAHSAVYPKTETRSVRDARINRNLKEAQVEFEAKARERTDEVKEVPHRNAPYKYDGSAKRDYRKDSQQQKAPFVRETGGDSFKREDDRQTGKRYAVSGTGRNNNTDLNGNGVRSDDTSLLHHRSLDGDTRYATDPMVREAGESQTTKIQAGRNENHAHVPSGSEKMRNTPRINRNLKEAQVEFEAKARERTDEIKEVPYRNASYKYDGSARGEYRKGPERQKAPFIRDTEGGSIKIEVDMQTGKWYIVSGTGKYHNTDLNGNGVRSDDTAMLHHRSLNGDTRASSDPMVRKAGVLHAAKMRSGKNENQTSASSGSGKMRDDPKLNRNLKEAQVEFESSSRRADGERKLEVGTAARKTEKTASNKRSRYVISGSHSPRKLRNETVPGSEHMLRIKGEDGTLPQTEKDVAVQTVRPSTHTDAKSKQGVGPQTLRLIKLNRNLKEAQEEFEAKNRARPGEVKENPFAVGFNKKDRSNKTNTRYNVSGKTRNRRLNGAVAVVQTGLAGAKFLADLLKNKTPESAIRSGTSNVHGDNIRSGIQTTKAHSDYAYINKNVKDAQKEFEIHSRIHPAKNEPPTEKKGRKSTSNPIVPTKKNHLSSKKGNGHNYLVGRKKKSMSPPGVPSAEEQINLGNATVGNLKVPSAMLEKIVRLEKIIAKTGLQFALITATHGSDAGVGLRAAQDIGGTVALTIVGNAKVALSNGMNASLINHMDLYMKTIAGIKNKDIAAMAAIGSPHSINDLGKMIRGLNQALKEQGYPPIKGSGKLGYIQVLKFLHRNKDSLPQDVKDILNLMAKIYRNQSMMSGHGRLTAFRRLFMNYFRRYGQQCEAGQALYFTTTFISRSVNTLRYGWMTIKSTAYAAHFAVLTAAKAAAWAAAKAAQTRLAQMTASAGRKALSAAPAGVKKAVNVASTGTKQVGRGARFLNKYARRATDFVRDPFHVKSRIRTGLRQAGAGVRAVGQRLLNTKAGRVVAGAGRVVSYPVRAVLRPIRIIQNIIGNIISHISVLVSAVIGVILLMILFLFIALLLVGASAGAIGGILTLFDFSASEDEIREAAFETIQTCYDSQNSNISSMYSRFRNMTVVYEDVKDEEAYAENPPDTPFTETTNSAELLCMATVYFDFDLEDAGKTQVQDYIRKLYNGSHLTSIETHTETVTTDDGDAITYTDAVVTLKTYYFNELFNCSLRDSYGTLQGSSVAEQVWFYFTSAGFSEEATAGIMGNLYQESGMDPTRIQNGGAGPAAGICQMETYMDYSTRWGTMARKAEAKGRDWTDLESQLEFMIDDMPGQFREYTGRSPHYYPNGEWCWWPEVVTIDSYKALKDIDKATEIFERVFERASKPNMSRRIDAAHNYYNMYKGTTPASEAAQTIVSTAYSLIGTPYEWGGTDPATGLDCSGLVGYCYKQAGITLPRTSDEIHELGEQNGDDVTSPMPGDVCWKEGHVAIYVGNGKMIEAPDIGQKVKVSDVSATKFYRFWR